MCEKKASPLEGILKDLLSGIHKKEALQGELENAWYDAVGVKAARHSIPRALKKGTLAVEVDGSGWLYELTVQKRELLKKLEAALKGRKIKDIRFRIGEVKERK